jgi:hypothetical protein
MKRLPFAAVLVLQALLVAAALRPDIKAPADVDQAVFRANYERWMTLPDTERDALRDRWTRFAALPAGDQESMLQRSDALFRISSSLQQRTGRVPTADENAAELQSIVDGAQQALLRGGGAHPTNFKTQMGVLTHRHIEAFFNNLKQRGDMSGDDVQKLLRLPLSEKIRETLTHLKADQLSRYSEGLPAEDADKAVALSPYELAAKSETVRDQKGFLGRLGDALDFSKEERAQIDACATTPERRETMLKLKEPRIRELLEQHGMTKEAVDALFNEAINELERDADQCLGPPPAPAAPPAGAR